MSLDARVSHVTKVGNEYRLHLVDRDSQSTAGQSILTILNSDEQQEDSVMHLRGHEIWGDANNVMLGEKKIATRESYTSILLLKGWMEAVELAHMEKIRRIPR